MKLEISEKVRFSETDALGHVNNTSYFVYLENARVHFFEAVGQQMDAKNWNFILASTKCDFINQAYFSQKLAITTSVTKIGTKSFHLYHEILDEQTRQVISKGNEAIVYFNFQTQQSEPLPEKLRAELEQYLVTV
ncbi:acyl-CoA thioesterase [Bacillus timonensis]|nr:acyl-CoA thioesterase [Bacillus timonensis]